MIEYDYVVSAAGTQVTQTLPPPQAGHAQPTIITASYPDGRMKSVTGTGTHPQYYAYGVEPDGSSYATWSQVTSSTTDAEITRQYSNALGQDYRTVHGIDSMGAPIAESFREFDGTGNIVRTIDPDGIETRSLNGMHPDRASGLPTGTNLAWDGEWSLAAEAGDTTGQGSDEVAFSGDDRVSQTLTHYFEAGTYPDLYAVQRTTAIAWDVPNDPDEVIVLSVEEAHTNGLTSSSSAFGLTSSMEVEIDRQTATRTVTRTAPDGTVSITISEYGRTVEERLEQGSGPVVVERKVTTEYDPHGRVDSVTDHRDTTTAADDMVVSYEYNNADRRTVVHLPAASAANVEGQRAVDVEVEYDALGRVIEQRRFEVGVSSPPTDTVSTTYFPTGEVESVSGDDTYTVEYTYDSRGRMATMTTFQDDATPAGEAVTVWNYDDRRGWLVNKQHTDPPSTVLGEGPTFEYTTAGRVDARTWSRLSSTSTALVTSYVYNDFGDIEEINYSDTTQDLDFTYDRLGRLATVVDAAGARSLHYSDASQLEHEEFSGGLFPNVDILHDYDSLFRRTELKAGVNLVGTGTVTTYTDVDYTYDDISRLESVRRGNHVATYAFVPGTSLIDTVAYGVGSTGSVVDRMVGTRVHDGRDRLHSIDWEWVHSTGNPGPESYEYTYNRSDQRIRIDRADGSDWIYGYDDLGQVTSARRVLERDTQGDPTTYAPGEQFEFDYDDIGNRIAARLGGTTALATGLRETTYDTNLLNQYTQRARPGETAQADIIGYAPAASTSITVNSNNAYRFGNFDDPVGFTFDDYYQYLLSLAVPPGGSASDPLLEAVSVDVTPGTADDRQFSVFLPASPEVYTYDDDGNVLSDGRWEYSWNGENQLAEMRVDPNLASDLGLARLVIRFKYDYLGRRIEKSVWEYPDPGNPLGSPPGDDDPIQDEGSAGDTDTDPNDPAPSDTLLARYRFLYDQWNVIVEIGLDPSSETLTDTLLRAPVWGLDLSGSEHGAAGTGGLVMLHAALAPGGAATYFPTFDGNANVTGMLSDAGVRVAQYEYGPFGESLVARGIYASLNPWRFSNRYTDIESGLVYYGFRYYNASTGRWLNNDPLGETASANLYAHNLNNPIAYVDVLGMVTYEGPSAGIISWVGAVSTADKMATLASYAANPPWFMPKRGLGVALAGLASGLELLDLSSNPMPPVAVGRSTMWPSNNKEHRGALFFTPSVDCRCGRVADAWTSWNITDPGWTPLRVATPRQTGTFRYNGFSIPIIGFTGRTTLGYEVAEMHARVNGQGWTLGKVIRGSRCVTITKRNASRVGMPLSAGMIGLGTPPPWIWRRIEYKLCCDGTGSVQFSGSHFPSHRAYIGGTALPGFHRQNNMSGFLMSGAVLVPGVDITATDVQLQERD